MTGPDLSTKVIASAKSNPWYGVVLVAFLLGIAVATFDGRVAKAQADATAALDAHHDIATQLSALTRDMGAVLCALDSTKVQGCYHIARPNIGDRRP